MGVIEALVLGALEGVTEFLPISSTGHLLLAEKLLALPDSEFVKTFAIAIQFGAILAIIALYCSKVLLKPAVLTRVAIAFVPTAVVGFGLYKIIKSVLLAETAVVLSALLIGGVIMILFEKWHGEKTGAIDDLERVSYKTSFWIGVCQALAVIPGVSRAAATIIGGLALGLSRRAIVEFSFLLAVPTMAAAAGYDLLKTGPTIQGNEWLLLLIGAAVAFVTALFTVKWLLRFIGHHTFTSFGVYRILVAVVFWLIIF